MKLRIRRILSAVLVLAMVVSFLPALDLSVKTSAATSAAEPTQAVFDYVADISQYRVNTETHDANNNNKFDKETVYTDYPAKAGYVFAGWYLDTVNMTPLSADTKTGGAYAKFVPENLLKAVAQVSTTTDYTTEASALRFVAAVESLNYNQVGFLLNKEGSSKTYTHGAVIVYTTLSAALEGGSLTPGYFHSTGSHMFSLTITGIKDQTDNYQATPFWITLDGTKVDHIQTSNKAVEMGIKANVAAGRTEIPADMGWYKTSADTLYISNAAELKAFAEMSKTMDFAGKTIKLTADITLNTGDAAAWSTTAPASVWEGIGTTDIPFAGTFDGQGHTISGVYYKNTVGSVSTGLFTAVTKATIKNLTVANSAMLSTAGSGNNGILVGLANGVTVENVKIANDVTLTGSTHSGTIAYAAGTNPVNIKNVWMDGTISNGMYTARFGGIVGFCDNTTGLEITLENCLFTGELNQTHASTTAENYVGGLVGATPANVKVAIKNSLSTGTITKATASGNCYVGSLIGITSWRGAAYTSFTNTYAATETYATMTYRAATAYTGTPTQAALADLTGAAAITNASGLDFVNGWVGRKVGAPVPKVFTTNDCIDISWYNDTDTEFVITTAAQLNGLAYLSTDKAMTFADKTVKLAADIVMNEGDASTWGTTAPAISWSPIGDGSDGWKGTFDGQGHTVSGLYCNNTKYATFIGRIYAGGAVKNVKIVNSYFVSTGTGDSFHNGAGIIGRMTGAPTVSGIYTNAILKGVKGVGIVAFSDSGAVNMSNCWFDGKIDVTGATNVGGMVSSVANNTVHTFTDCLFTGTMVGTAGSSAYIGGIYGIGPYSATIKMTNCLVAGDMTAITAGKTGAITGNNPGGNKSSHSNVFVTSETHTAVAGAGGTLSNFKYTAVAESTILGDAAKSVLTGFDFTTVWGTRNGQVPKLTANASNNNWYDPDASEYILYTAADLYGFSVLQETVNFKDKVIKLGADIILNEGDAKTWATTAPENVWNPIGKGDASLSFEGTFDGQGHSISGLYYESASYGGGLFTFTGTSAVIKDLKLVNSYIKSTYGAEWSATGSVAAFVNGTTFINVYSDAIIDTNSGYTGGIGGRVQGAAIEAENCEFAGTITATGTVANYIGGIFGGYNTNVASVSSVKNCVMSGTVTAANNYVGGLSGCVAGVAATGGLNVDGFKMTGTVSGANTYIGGMLGAVQLVPTTVTNADISGNINATVGVAGGIAGQVANGNLTVTDSTVTATINGGTKLGGFVGQTATAGFTTTIRNSTFDGTVTGTNTSETIIAGFVAHVNNGNAYVQNCYAKGTLNAPGPYSAGVIAQIVNVAGVNVLVEKTIVTTNNQCASSNAGGIIGRIMGTNPTVVMKNNAAKATFKADSWCTAQIVAHAQGDNVDIVNNFFVQTANSYSGGIESSGGNVTHSAVKVSEAVFDELAELYMAGMYPDYNGFVDSGFVIKDAEDLYGFNFYNELNSGMSGKTVKLANDITVNEGNASDWAINAPKYNWKPIGAIASAAKFAGTFDGQGHTISGLYCAYASGNSMGMFREVTGTVQSFKLLNSYLENTVDSTYGYNGGIVAYLNGGTLSQVYTDAIVKTTGSYAGGLVGFTGGTTATVSECVFDGLLMARCHVQGGCDTANGTIRAHARYVGGIVGNIDATTTVIKDCVISGKIYNEDTGAHRTGGVIGGAYTSGKQATITGCFIMPEMYTMNHQNNSYHFNMVMDMRNNSGTTQPTNVATLFDDNYVLATKLYSMTGAILNSGGNITGGNSGTSSTIRYTQDEMVAKVVEQLVTDTAPLDLQNTWIYNPGALPTLKWLGGEQPALNYHYVDTETSRKLLTVTMPGKTLDQYVDMTIEETPTGSTYQGEVDGETVDLPYYYLEQINAAPVDFKDIFYGEDTYLTKYTGTTLADAQNLIADMKDFGFTEYATNNINDDCYYTALLFGGKAYTVTFFAKTGETYISASNEQKFSPFLKSDYFKTAVNTAEGEPSSTYSDVTITSVPLDNGGDAFIIRLKNGHYLVVDGGTNRQSDRDRVAEALGASADAYNAGDKNNPQIVVDGWFYTHAHADHAALWRGGIYGALQVDVYIKGFYFNFSEKWYEDEQVKVGGTEDSPVYADGYMNPAYAYEDQDDSGRNYYKKGVGDTTPFWVEYTATHKTAAVVNTPAWGSRNIPIYRVQAGQKLYFDGMTVEIPYTQEQTQPSELNLDLNGTGTWFLFTDDYGHTFLDTGDAERFNAVAVTELYSDNYKLFGADVGKLFHHGLNPLVEFTGTFGEEPSASTAGHYNYDLTDQIYGIDTNYGDGQQTKFVFITKGASSWLQISGYNNCGGSQRDLSIHEMYYLFGYILTSTHSSILGTYYSKVRDYVSWGYETVANKIPFAAYGGTFTSGNYTDTFEGTTTVTMNESGVTWDKAHTFGIYD